MNLKRLAGKSLGPIWVHCHAGTGGFDLPQDVVPGPSLRWCAPARGHRKGLSGFWEFRGAVSITQGAKALHRTPKKPLKATDYEGQEGSVLALLGGSPLA